MNLKHHGRFDRGSRSLYRQLHLETLENRTLLSATAQMVKDIRSGTNSADPFNLTNVGGTLFFEAAQDANGHNLWKSDGTAAGTVLVWDLTAEMRGAVPRGLTAVADTLYFTMDDSVEGADLWKSDGTKEGTVVVRHFATSRDDSELVELTNVNGTLYFLSHDELWKSDGTEEGTVLVRDIVPGPNDYYPDDFTEMAGMLYFAVPINFASALWKERWHVGGHAADHRFCASQFDTRGGRSAFLHGRWKSALGKRRHGGRDRRGQNDSRRDNLVLR